MAEADDTAAVASARAVDGQAQRVWQVAADGAQIGDHNVQNVYLAATTPVRWPLRIGVISAQRLRANTSSALLGRRVGLIVGCGWWLCFWCDS